MLQVAEEHARQAGVLDRDRTIPGDAFAVDYDAYTFAEIADQLSRAGFCDVESHLTPTPETVVIARKA